jgi:hypothetical protein
VTNQAFGYYLAPTVGCQVGPILHQAGESRSTFYDVGTLTVGTLAFGMLRVGTGTWQQNFLIGLDSDFSRKVYFEPFLSGDISVDRMSS